MLLPPADNLRGTIRVPPAAWLVLSALVAVTGLTPDAGLAQPASNRLPHGTLAIRERVGAAYLCIRLPAGGGNATLFVKKKSAVRHARAVLRTFAVDGVVRVMTEAHYEALGRALSRQIARGEPRRFHELRVRWPEEAFGEALCPRVRLYYQTAHIRGEELEWAKRSLGRYSAEWVELERVPVVEPA